MTDEIYNKAHSIATDIKNCQKILQLGIADGFVKRDLSGIDAESFIHIPEALRKDIIALTEKHLERLTEEFEAL